MDLQLFHFGKVQNSKNGILYDEQNLTQTKSTN